MFELTLPYPISINHYYKNRANSKKYLPKVVEDYRMEVFVAFKNSKLKPFEDDEDLFVEIILYPPDRRKRDIDNGCKCLLDSLQHAKVFKDDNQISKLVVERSSKIEGYASVTIGQRCFL